MFVDSMEIFLLFSSFVLITFFVLFLLHGFCSLYFTLNFRPNVSRIQIVSTIDFIIMLIFFIKKYKL